LSIDIRSKLAIENKRLNEINVFLLDPNNKLVTDLLSVINKYGSPEEINKKARESSKLENIMKRLKKNKSSYVEDLEWLIDQKDKSAFITINKYRRKILGDKAKDMDFKENLLLHFLHQKRLS